MKFGLAGEESRDRPRRRRGPFRSSCRKRSFGGVTPTSAWVPRSRSAAILRMSLAVIVGACPATTMLSPSSSTTSRPSSPRPATSSTPTRSLRSRQGVVLLPQDPQVFEACDEPCADEASGASYALVHSRPTPSGSSFMATLGRRFRQRCTGALW